MNQNNLKDIVISTFQEILAEDPNFFFTDRLTILTWKSKKIEGALITKVGNRRYLGYLRKDSQGQDYWKYKPLNPEQSGEEKEGVNNSELSQKENSDQSNSSANNQPDNLAKFNQRQAQANNYGKSNNAVESSVSN